MILFGRSRLLGIMISMLIAASILIAGDKLPAPFKVIPQPQSVELLGGIGLKPGDLQWLQLKGAFARPVTGPLLSGLPEIDKGAGVLTLRLVNTDAVPPSAEGYVLSISNGAVDITSRGEAGLFYGCQTLEQLLEDARDVGVPVPACKITDEPAM